MDGGRERMEGNEREGMRGGREGGRDERELKG